MGQAALKSPSHRRYYLNKLAAAALSSAAMTPASFQRRDLDTGEYRAAVDNDRNGSGRSSLAITGASVKFICIFMMSLSVQSLGAQPPEITGPGVSFELIGINPWMLSFVPNFLTLKRRTIQGDCAAVPGSVLDAVL